MSNTGSGCGGGCEDLLDFAVPQHRCASRRAPRRRLLGPLPQRPGCAAVGVNLHGARVSAGGGFDADTWTSTGITYPVEISSDASDDEIARLLAPVGEVAEIPRTVRAGSHSSTHRLTGAHRHQRRSTRTTRGAGSCCQSPRATGRTTALERPEGSPMERITPDTSDASTASRRPPSPPR